MGTKAQQLICLVSQRICQRICVNVVQSRHLLNILKKRIYSVDFLAHFQRMLFSLNGIMFCKSFWEIIFLNLESSRFSN